MLYNKIIDICFFKPIDFSSEKLFIDHNLFNIFYLCKILICIHRIYYKTCSPCIYKHYKSIHKKMNTRSTFDFIQPYNKYNYINNSLMSYGPRILREFNIYKRKLASISLLSNTIFNYFVTLYFF